MKIEKNQKLNIVGKLIKKIKNGTKKKKKNWGEIKKMKIEEIKPEN